MPRLLAALAAFAVACALAPALSAAADADADAAAHQGLAADDQALVDQAATYLDSLTSVKGRFTQIDARGQVVGGTLYLKRPGLARFVYDPPSSLLVVSDGRTVTVTNPRLKTTDRYPLSFTPLSVLLGKHAGLGHGVSISRVTRLGDGFALTAHAAGHRGAGQVTITFRTDPLRLSAWTMTDAEGQTTEVRLTELKGAPLDSSLFTPPSYYDRRDSAPQ
ncbi:MAG TPA: outer membrane lipoprotein carrier protein LolA [Caulobacteraceae bacterium]|nr:outer membrane lipoprotein carrier protein LolA [Caulobacteraceae bacterium]